MFDLLRDSFVRFGKGGKRGGSIDEKHPVLGVCLGAIFTLGVSDAWQDTEKAVVLALSLEKSKVRESKLVGWKLLLDWLGSHGLQLGAST